MLPWSKKQTGDYYEQQACRHLTSCGLKVLEKNARFRYGEIDLIMMDGNCIVFVEVKFRKRNNYGVAAGAISRKKRERLYAAAEIWLGKQGRNSIHTEFRFDAITFDGDVNSINWIKNFAIEGF
ncbi:YraN family protein [Veronia pacifica]|uniref:UPF0102 protein A8L45_07410 n=1 Tax=Veronia pacifica TaxID=1080227 RepID=A0A1C3ELI7_9GAMM|nr:YraN family protein [Veronia pacifica]